MWTIWLKCKSSKWERKQTFEELETMSLIIKWIMEINSAISTTDTFTKGNEKKKKIILQSKNVKKCYFLIVKLWHAGQILLLEIWSWKVSESQERYQIWVKTVFSNSFIYQVNFQNKLRLQRNISNFILNFPSKLERKSCRRWHEKVAMKPQRLSVWFSSVSWTTLFSSEKYGN